MCYSSRQKRTSRYAGGSCLNLSFGHFRRLLFQSAQLELLGRARSEHLPSLRLEIVRGRCGTRSECVRCTNSASGRGGTAVLGNRRLGAVEEIRDG